MPQEVILQTLGPCSVRIAGVPVILPAKGYALLAYLAASGRAIDRPLLAELLWGGPFASRSRQSLNQTLYTLNQLLPSHTLLVDKSRLGLNGAVIAADIEQLKHRFSNKQYAEVVNLYGGPFLSSLHFISEDFDDWRASVAARVDAEVLFACREMVADAAERADAAAAARFAEAGLAIHPLDEALLRVRIESLAATGAFHIAESEIAQQHANYVSLGEEAPTNLTDELQDIVRRARDTRPETESSTTSLPICGRNDELRVIKRSIEDAQTGAVVLVLRGPPGIGKSKLLQQGLRRAAIAGSRVMAYTCSEVDKALPYSAMAGLLRDGGHIIKSKEVSEHEAAVLASIVPDLFPEVGAVRQVSRLTIFETVALRLTAITQATPVAVAVDNYQWIDTSSRIMLAYLQKRLTNRPFLLLTAGRGDYSPVVHEDENSRTRFLAVEPLDDIDSAELIMTFEQQVSVHVPEELKKSLIQRVGGLPLLLLELLHHFRSVGNVSDYSKTLAIDTVDAILGRRLEHLSANAGQLLAAAAVLNREVHLFQLSHIAALDTISAAIAADELIKASILIDSVTIRFSHDLMRDVVIRRLSSAERIRWHYQAAIELARSGSDRFAEVAYHFEESGDAPSAYLYAQRSVAAAERMLADDAVDDAYARMLRCANRQQLPDVRVQWFRHLVHLGRLREAGYIGEAVRECFQARNDKEGEVLCSIVNFVNARCGAIAGSGSWPEAKEVIALTEEHTPERLAAVLWHLVDPIRNTGNHQILTEFGVGLATYARDRHQEPRVAAELYCVAALVTMLGEGFLSASQLAEAAVASAAFESDGPVLARALYARGTVALSAGQLQVSARDYETLLAESLSRFVPDEMRTRVKTNYSIVLLEQGRFDDAASVAQEALREAALPRRSYAFGNLALIALRAGDTEAVRHYCKALSHSYGDTGYTWIKAHVSALEGLAALQQGNRDLGRILARDAWNSLGSASAVTDSSPIIEVVARVAAADGDFSSAIMNLRQGQAHLRTRDLVAALRLQLIELELTDDRGGESLSSLRAEAARGHMWDLVRLADGLMLRTRA
jgi:DNA-binding SARP family transcriptional activator/Tfp pilus assembly protein PilF